MKRTYFREGNAEHGLQELGKRWELGMVLEKRGKHFVQKMVGFDKLTHRKSLFG